MQNLVHQRCFNHATREAVARCPECGQCFCRECITEHDDRVVCAACLKKLTQPPFQQRPAFVNLLRAVQCALGILLAWFFFFLIGEGLLKLPASFHEGTLWQASGTDPE
ncbi:MAG TPA: rhomboid family protein [Verrucomicrobiae bacterium]|nr:rhomboid family protein [Verrucomicrobiae bacterium]